MLRKQKTPLDLDWSLAVGTVPEMELRWVEVQGDDVYVLGIAHSDISVGDTFTHIHQYAPNQVLQDAAPHFIDHINLHVETITAFHNQLNRISSGQSAGLLLSGHWAPLVQSLTVLGWDEHAPRQFHQWQDRLEHTTKLTLSR